MNDDLKKILAVYVRNPDDKLLNFIRDNLNGLREYTYLLYDGLIKTPNIGVKELNYVSLNDSIEISKSFLRTISKEYEEKLDKLVKNGSLDYKETKKGNSFVNFYYDEKNVRYDIIIYPTYTIEDVYSIIHEFFHVTNYKIEHGFDRVLLTESISIFYEFLLYEFLKDKEYAYEDAIYPVLSRIESSLDDTYAVNMMLEDINSSFEKLDISNIVDIPDKEIDKTYYDLSNSLKYSLSTLIAIVMYYDYKNHFITMKNIESYNKSIANNENLESLRNILLGYPSYKKVNKSIDFFRKEIFEKNINKSK